jgi:xylulokinase
MSVIGIDVGSSSIKMCAYRSNGRALAKASEGLTPRRPRPGWWEIDPEEVWKATLKGLSQIARAPWVRRDPPEVIAISASGREIFPVDQHGRVLGPCIMAGDTRGADIEQSTATRVPREEWYFSCGHIPERMDPVNRLLWWRQNAAKTASRAKLFLGWHEFLTFRLGGRAVTDRSLAGKWLIYDLASGQWSPQRLAEFDIDPVILPEIQPWGAIVSQLGSRVASQTGLSRKVKIGVGAFDASCATLGAGASSPGVAGLVSGTWEDVIAPATQLPPTEIVDLGFSVGPHPSAVGLAVFSLSPNGTAALDWARNLLGISLPRLEDLLENSGSEPSAVLAVPHLSGATVCWSNGRKSRGALLGMNLASSRTDVIKSLMESITYDLLLAVRSFRQANVEIRLLRAAGGGTRSAWWTQLKADLLGVPIEVVNQKEPGTLGAALLAGLAAGTYPSLEEGSTSWISAADRYEPDPKRAALHAERLEIYQATVSSLLRTARES